MNILQFQQSPEDFADSNSPDFSIEEETEQLINEVFNKKYQPVYNPTQTKQKQTLYKQQKQQENKHHHHKLLTKEYGNRKIYQNVEDSQLTSSFSQFLLRAQEKIDCRNSWLMKEREKKKEKQIKTLQIAPQILRGSRQKLLPLYERCIDLQKTKEKNLQVKRIQKTKEEADKIQKISFKPRVNPSKRQRTFEQYLSDKSSWKRERDEEVEKKRMILQVQRLSECTFEPQLIATYRKPNSRLIPGESVEDRLLRSLQRSLSKEHTQY